MDVRFVLYVKASVIGNLKLSVYIWAVVEFFTTRGVV